MVEQSLWAPRRAPETPEEIALEEQRDAESLRLSERIRNMTPEEEQKLQERICLLLECIGPNRFDGRVRGHKYEISAEGLYVCTNCGGTSRDGVDYSRVFEDRPITSEALNTILD